MGNVTSYSHTPAPWFAVESPVLTSLGPDGRQRHATAILERAEAILRPIELRYRIDFCFALEEAAAQLRKEGKL